MKVKHIFLLSLLLAILAFFPACEDCGDCVVPENDYSKGIFVVNEGPFGGTGTITWHNPATGETVQDVFGKENNGAALGLFVQSLTFYNDKGYIVVNGANKIVVVDAKTFEFLDTIGGLALPRFFQRSLVNPNVAYVSQWGADGVSGSLAVVDLVNNQVIKTIPTGSGPEKMFALNSDVLYVANSGGFGVDSTVAVFSMFLEEVQNKFVLGEKNPACLANSGNQTFALCKGYFNDANSVGWLGDFGPNTVSIPADKYADDLVTAPDGSTLYFLGGGAIWTFKNNTVSKLFDQAAYGLACHPTTGDLYCADAKDFNSAGEVVIYKPDGTKTGTFPTGIAPGEIVIVE
jgi:YVTN family beta-propeller protein